MATIPNDDFSDIYNQMLALWRANYEGTPKNLQYRTTQRALLQIQRHESFLVPGDLKPGGRLQGYLFGIPVVLVSDEDMPGADVSLLDVYYEDTP